MISDEDLARHLRMPLGDVLDLLCSGRIVGAFYHRRDRCWYVPLPVRFHYAP